MEPLDHPDYKGFKLQTVDQLETLELQEVIQEISRRAGANYETGRAELYGASEFQTQPEILTEYVYIPAENRVAIYWKNSIVWLKAPSLKSAVREWMKAHERDSQG